MPDPQETMPEKLERFQAALDQFIQRLQEDRYVLAVVLRGRLDETTIWRKEALSVWIIEADGVSRRLRSDGNEERIFRILTENEINIHAEVIPRSRFKQMVEGSSRTAFSCNFFESRRIVYSQDKSIQQWFDSANTIATKDKERELLQFSTWTFYAIRSARKLLEHEEDLSLAQQQILNAAHSLAYTEIIRAGEICEDIVIQRAVEISPKLFETIYLDVMAKRKNRKVMETALSRIDQYLQEHHQQHLKPLLTFLKKEDRIVALSEISDYFAFSQIYPWHIEAACEWLVGQEKLQKLSASFKLTKRSQEPIEEPAYYFET